MSNILNLLSLRPKIEKFCEEFFVLDQMNIVDTKWAFQFTNASLDGEIVYYPPACGLCPDKKAVRCSVHKRQLTLEHLYDHFSQESFKAGNERRGTLAFVPNFKGKTKTFIIDFDNEDATAALYTKIIPELNRMKEEFIIEVPPEFTGLALKKAHLIMKTELMDIRLLKTFADTLMEQCKVDVKALKLELFPTHKNTLIRLVGGRHLRKGRDCAYPVLYKNVLYSDVDAMLDALNTCTKLSVKTIQEYILTHAPSKLEDTEKAKPKKLLKRFHYVPRNLPLEPKVADGMPEDMKCLATNCQAINKLMNLVYQAKLLNDSGTDTHNEGKFIANLAMDFDIRNGGIDGETWFYNALNETRDRSDESHKWFAKEYYEDNPDILIPRCETWESYFGLCGGCTWKNYSHFTNPRQLKWGKQIKKKKLFDIQPVTVDQIRETTIKLVTEKTLDYVRTGQFRKDMVIASPPSAGKTYAADKLAVDLAAEGYNIIIAVPSGDLADQHVEQIRTLGGDAFKLKSHDSWFKGKNGVLEFNDCPEKEEIGRLVDLGLGAKTIQKKFCSSCPLLETCPYPGQYSKAALPTNNIVVIQHAHFGCRETMFTLFREKQFNLLIVDEEFISNITKDLKVSDAEIAVIREQVENVEWVGSLLEWFEGSPPSEEGIKASETDLELLKDRLEARNCPWNIPEYITHYNSARTYDKRLGLFVFYPVPDIPVRLFTDATPPLEMLEIVLDNKNIEVFGSTEILDLQASNKENTVIQVLDSSTSKAALSKNDYELFYEILEYIGDDITNSFAEPEDILLTLYKDEDRHNFTSQAEDWLRKNYPSIFEKHKIIFGRLALGTNDYQYCAAQYQVAGMHYNTLQLHQAAYKLKCIANFWNRLKGRPQIVNMYPWHVTPTSPLDVIYTPLFRYEIDPIDGPGYYQYEFNPDKPFAGLYQAVPKDKHLQICYKLAAAKKQQAMRIIRNKTTKKQKVVIFDKEERPTQATNQSVMLHDLLGYLR